MARRRDAVRIGVGKILPDHNVVGIHFDCAGVAGIGHQGVSVFQAAGEGDGAQRAAGGECFDNHVVSCDFKHAGVVFVRDEDMAVFQQFSGIGAVQLVRRIGIGTRIGPHNFFAQVHFNDPVIALIGDENVLIGQPSALHGSVQHIRA